MNYQTLSIILKQGRYDEAATALEEDAKNGKYTDILSSNGIIYNAFDQSDHQALSLIVKYYEKYFLEPYDISSDIYLKNFARLVEAIGNSAAADEDEDRDEDGFKILSKEMSEIIAPFLKSHNDSSTESAIDHDDRAMLDFGEDADVALQHLKEVEKIDPKFMHVFSPESESSEEVSMLGCEAISGGEKIIPTPELEE